MWTDADRETYKDEGRRYPSDLTDEQWATIAPLLSGYDPLTADLREMINACLYLEKTGCPWRYLPTDFGPRPTVRTWHDRFRADGLWSEIAAPLTRAVRQKRGRKPEPSTGILDPQSVACGPQAGPRGTDGNKKVRGIKRHVLTCSLGFVLTSLVTAANVHDTQAAGMLLDRAAQDGWRPERSRSTASTSGRAWTQRPSVTAWTSRSPPERDTKGFQPLPLRWRIETTFGTQTNRYRRLTRNLEHSPAAAEDAIDIANCHRLMRAYHRKTLHSLIKQALRASLSGFSQAESLGALAAMMQAAQAKRPAATSTRPACSRNRPPQCPCSRTTAPMGA